MASELRVNTINSRTGFGTITVSETGQDLVGITTIENLTTENTLVGAAASFTGNVQIGGVLTYEDVTNIDSVGLITARQGIEIGARPGVAASISVDGNMVVSGISTFAGATYLSSNVDVAGELTVADMLGHTGDTHTKLSFPANDTIAFTTGGTERVRVGSGGDVSVGGHDTNYATSPLEVRGTTAGGDVAIRVTNNSTTAGSQAGIIFTTTTSDYTTAGIGYERGGTADALRFYVGQSNSGGGFTNATERLRITSTGHMGLGVTPSAWPTNADSIALQIGTGFVAYGRGSGDEDRGGIAVNYYNDGSNEYYIGNGNANRIYLNDGNIDFQYAGTNSSGAAQALTFSQGARLSSAGSFILNGTANTFGGTVPLLELQKNSSGTGPKITMYNGEASEAGAECEIQVGHNYREAARIIFGRNNANNWQTSAANASSNIQFHTNNAGTVGEKVRVGAGSGSYFMVGTTNNRVTGSSFNYPTLGIQHTGTGYNSIGINQIRPNLAGILFKGYQQTSGNYYANYMVDSNDQLCGHVLVNTSNQTVSYTNSSDYRLKQDDVPITNGITRVKQLRPIRFKWKSDLSEQDGFFAHEVQAVVPEAVVGEKDAVMDTAEKAGPHTIDANVISPQQLDTRHMVPLLTAALQEAIAKIETLESEVAALKSS